MASCITSPRDWWNILKIQMHFPFWNTYSFSDNMKSMRSVLSIKSGSSGKSQGAFAMADNVPEGFIFDEVIPSTCAKFNCPCVVVVIKEENQRKGNVKKDKSKSKKIMFFPPMSMDTKLGSGVSTQSQPCADGRRARDDCIPPAVAVTAVYDSACRLVEVQLVNAAVVPRILLQVIALYAPYLDSLTKVTIHRSRIDPYTIHELSKMIEVSHLSEVSLEDTPLTGGNYAMLLDKGNLQRLSLCRCEIDDAVCEEISARLHCSQSERSLLFLDLSSNHVTDEGARYLGAALRTNRKLLCLNLADNRLTDVGAGHLLDPLCEFRLTYDELIGKRSSYFKYLRRRKDLVSEMLNNIADQDCASTAASEPIKSKSLGFKRRSSATSITRNSNPRSYSDCNEYIKAKTELLVSEMQGPFADTTAVRDGYTYCAGNMVLASLNLSYNRLSFLSVKKILRVLTHQNDTRKQQTGLVRIVIEGNPLPQACPEMDSIRQLISTRIGGKISSETGKRKSRGRLPSNAST